jgi:hypothetical protein
MTPTVAALFVQPRGHYAGRADVDPAALEFRKRCSRCGALREATLEFFPPDKRRSDGFSSLCRVCSRLANRELRAVKRQLNPRASNESRLWKLVNKLGPVPIHCAELGHCWVWIGRVGGNGYARFSVGGRKVYAHRFSWSLAHDGVEATNHVLHKCDNPRCVNPEHLFEGTDADNVRDMHQKGRARKALGEQSAKAKLTAADVSELRRLSREGQSFTELGVMFGISGHQAGVIARGLNWRHVT